MIITVDKDFQMDKDEFCYTLKESLHKKDKRGNDMYKVHGYFSNLSSAIKHLRNVKTERLCEKKESVTLSEYIELLQDMNNRIEQLIQV